MTLLIPQLPSDVAEALLPELALARPADLDPGDEFRHPQVITQPTGGLPVTDDLLKQLRESIVTSARRHGFPGSRPTSFLGFELEVAESLAQWPPLWKVQGEPSGEALRNDCWTFITILLLPDVALWRWPAKGDDESPSSRSWKGRMVGGGRNAFQRIFRRVMCLDRGLDHPDRWGLIRSLQEDDFSAILERPGLSSNRDIAVCLGEEYLAMKERLGLLPAAVRQDVYRQATKAIRAYSVVQPLDLLPSKAREDLIHSAFVRCEAAVVSSSALGDLYQDSPAPEVLKSRTIETIDASSMEEASPPPVSKNPKRNLLRRLLSRGT